MFARIWFSIRTHGAKIIWAPTNNIDREVDLNKYPWELEFDLSHPEFHRPVYVMKYGGSQNFIVRGKSREALTRLLKVLKIEGRDDVIQIKITDPDGNVEQLRSLFNRTPT